MFLCLVLIVFGMLVLVIVVFGVGGGVWYGCGVVVEVID